MDLCHCATPVTAPGNSKGDLVCAKCGLWFVKESWQRDSRVRAARKQAASKQPCVVKEPARPAVDNYAPCPCGSGKKRKFCHGNRIVPL